MNNFVEGILKEWSKNVFTWLIIMVLGCIFVHTITWLSLVISIAIFGLLCLVSGIDNVLESSPVRNPQ